VLEDAVLKVLSGKAVFRGEASFKTWWFGVIRITALEDRRRHWRRDRALLRYEREVESNEAPEGGDRGDSESERLVQVLKTLSPRQREVMHLVFYQGLTIEEAGEVMGVSVGTARRHYERAKTALRARLNGLSEQQ